LDPEVLLQDHLTVEVSKEDLAVHLVILALVAVVEETVLMKILVDLVDQVVVVIVINLVDLEMPEVLVLQREMLVARLVATVVEAVEATLKQVVMELTLILLQLVDLVVMGHRSLIMRHHYFQRCQLLGKIR
jgi:hypothetical protein